MALKSFSAIFTQVSIPTRVTQKKIAQKLGLTQATVSLALSDHPSIPSKTRERIKRAAGKLQYTPDPFLSGLSAYRNRSRPPRYQATLAWLTNYPEENGWKYSSVFRGYFEGATLRAHELGYLIEEHWLNEKGMTSERMKRILLARNIHGLLLAPQPEPNSEIIFPFDHFPSVTFGYTLVKPKLHIAALHQFRAMKTLFENLMDLGYQRPGLALSNYTDLRADHNWSAAFLSMQSHLPTSGRVPPLLHDSFDQPVFAKWFGKYKPDVVITMYPRILDWLTQNGESVPQTVGLALLSVPDDEPTFSGIGENPRVVGAKAAEFLIDLIHRNERGIPDVQLCVLVEGTWKAGQTVRPLNQT